jgi:Flp pilus assembly pilin Flp
MRRRRHRRSRGAAMVELALVLPIFVVLIAAVGYLRDGYVTAFAAVHDARTRTWEVAMSNDPERCGTQAPGRLIGAPAWGRFGDEAVGLGKRTMTGFSFFYDKGGVERSATHEGRLPPGVLTGARPIRVTRSSFMPCNETINGDTGALPDAFDVLRNKYVEPRE